MSSNILEFNDASKNNKSMKFYLNEIANPQITNQNNQNNENNLRIFSNPTNDISFNIGENGLFKFNNIDLSDNLNIYGNFILEGSKISTDSSNIHIPITFNNYIYKLASELSSNILENTMDVYQDISNLGYILNILPKSKKSKILINLRLMKKKL